MAFQFKQFAIEQDQCAMKVSTDACLFGAYVAYYELAPAKVLDIGSGTGLLSLMLAQKFSKAQFDAVELDKQAVLQSRDNIKHSPWAHRIKVYHTPIQEYQPDCTYDLIISNPPFFDKALASPSKQRHMARHQDSLSLEELSEVVKHLLSQNGRFWLLLPELAQQKFSSINNGLFCHSWTAVEGRDNARSKRVIASYQREKAVTISEGFITIQDSLNNYTSKFQEFLFPILQYLRLKSHHNNAYEAIIYALG